MGFVKIDAMALVTYRRKLISARNLHISWPIWVKVGTEDLRFMPGSTYAFHENWCSKTHLFSGVNEILFNFCSFLFSLVKLSTGDGHTNLLGVSWVT